MAGIFHPSRGGVRGGQDQFNWDDVKTDKDRENYLGHSVMVPVGRWQEGKDLAWYTRNKGDNKLTADEKRKQELRNVKDIEARAMAAALGHKSFSMGSTSLTAKELQDVLTRGQTEHNEGDRIQGMGFKKSLRERKQAKYGTEFEGGQSTTKNIKDSESSKRVEEKSSKKKKKEKKKKKKKEKSRKRHDSFNSEDGERSPRNTRMEVSRLRHSRDSYGERNSLDSYREKNSRDSYREKSSHNSYGEKDSRDSYREKNSLDSYRDKDSRDLYTERNLRDLYRERNEDNGNNERVRKYQDDASRGASYTRSKQNSQESDNSDGYNKRFKKSADRYASRTSYHKDEHTRSDTRTSHLNRGDHKQLSRRRSDSFDDKSSHRKRRRHDSSNSDN